MISGVRTRFRSFALAVVSVTVALALSFVFRPAFADNPYLLFWPATVISAWFGGIPGGIAGALLGILAANYFFIDPTHILSLDPADGVRFALLVLTGTLLWSLRDRFQRVEEKQRFLSQAGALLESSLDYEKTLTEVARLAVPTIADWCVLDVMDSGGALRRLAVVHRDPAKQPLAEALKTRYPVLKPSERHTLLDVVRTGETWLNPTMSDERLRAGARDEEHYILLRELGFKSEIVTQLKARGNVLGTITLVLGESGRRYTPRDLGIAQDLARRAGLAIDNARLFRDVEAQRERLQVILGSIADGVIAADGARRVTYMNPVAAALTGWTEAEAIGKALDDVFPIRAVPESNGYGAGKATVNGAPMASLTADAVLKTRDGIELRVEHSAAPIKDSNAGLDGTVIVFRDVSERYAIEQERAEILRREHQARKAAEAANEMKLRFMGMISHELRTPLTSIKGFVSTLLASDVEWPAAQQVEFLSIADEEIDKLTELVDQLLEVTSLHGGTLRIRAQPQALDAIVDVARAQLQTISSNHQFVLDIPPDLPPIMADERRLAQVLVNLVNNAAKYSPQGSRIGLTARARDNAVQIDVADEGAGIAPDERALVFEPFRQGNRTIRANGAGLGLAICKGLVEAHGGSIWIADGAGPGTTVSFTVPVADVQP